jgi:hypothetical protein
MTFRSRQAYHVPDLDEAHDYDDKLVDSVFGKIGSYFGRMESMDIKNDPRFFAGNVMDKRLNAFAGMATVSSIMFGTALAQCFALKKNMNFEKHEDYVWPFNLATWQLIAFCLALLISIQCLLSMYIIAQQLYHTYRLMTAGSIGFDLAAVFYLTRTITMWRHLAIKMLFNGLLKFLVLVGIQLFIQFYKDASGVKDTPDLHGRDQAMIANMVNFSMVPDSQIPTVAPVHKLDMRVHAGIGWIVLFICGIVSAVMHHIRYVHKAAFEQNYAHCEEKLIPIERRVYEMGTRSKQFPET